MIVVSRTKPCLLAGSFGGDSANKEVSGQILPFGMFPEYFLAVEWNNCCGDDPELLTRLMDPSECLLRLLCGKEVVGSRFWWVWA